MLTGVLLQEQNCDIYKKETENIQNVWNIPFWHDSLCYYRSPCISGTAVTVHILLLFLSCALSRRTLLRPSTTVLPLWAGTFQCVWVSALCAALTWLSLTPSKWVKVTNLDNSIRQKFHCELLAVLWWPYIIQPSCPLPHQSSNRSSTTLNVFPFIYSSVEH